MLAPLHVHLLFHPDSKGARTLAEDLLADWMPGPTQRGLRVPVFLQPDREDGLPPADMALDTAQHSLVAVLVDAHLADFVDGQAEEWRTWLGELAAAHPIGGRHQIVPVVLDPAGFEVVGKRHAVVVTDDSNVRASVSFALSVRALHLLRNEAVPATDNTRGQLEAPITLFVSHAKKDLDPDKLDPVRLTQDALRDLPVREWFDARDIRYGASFDEDIRVGLERCDAALIYLTDEWSSRPWCLTEALIAKEVGVPTLVIDALDRGEERSFPYGGNTRTVRWAPATDPTVDVRRHGEAEGKRIVAAGVRQALGRVHARARLEGLAQEGDVVLSSAPEAARIAWAPSDSTFLYPDPPVGREERRLLERLLPDARFVTPLLRFAEARRGEATLAVSISESGDLRRLGLTERHERLISDEVYLYLLTAGLRIVYGGKLDPDRLDDPSNFTLRLVNLVRQTRDLAEQSDSIALKPILNAAPWPLWKLYGKEVKAKVFSRVTHLERLPLPPDFPLDESELDPGEGGFVPPGSPVQLYAWCRALTHMREWVTENSAARLVIGGRIEGYKGRMAGLIEEPLIQIRARRPLFLVGALGGCTRLVIDLLEGRERPEMSTAVARSKARHYQELTELYATHGGEMPSREEVATELEEFGAAGPAAALVNGLDDEENRELFLTTDPIRVAQLVLAGLERLGI